MSCARAWRGWSAELMEAEVAGADRRRARRGLAGAGHASQRVSAAAVADARRRDRAGDPEAALGQLLPELSGAAQALRAGAGRGRPGGLRQRRLHAQGRPAGRAARRRRDEQGRTSRRLCRGLDEQVRVFRERPLEGRYPYVWLDGKIEKVRERGAVRQKCLVIAYAVHEIGPARGDRPRRRRGRDRGVLARVPQVAAGPRPDAACGCASQTATRGSGPRSARCSAARGSAARCTSCGTCSATAPRASSR